MIKSFGDKETESFYITGHSTKIPVDIQEKTKRQLDFLDNVVTFQDLKNAPKGYRFHSLDGDLDGFFSISPNMKYRIIFKYEDGNIYLVEFTNHYK